MLSVAFISPMRYLSLLFIILTIIFCFSSPTSAENLVDAGFVNTLWYSQNDWYSNDQVRIYAALQNQSPYDLIGILNLYDNDRLVREAPFSIAKGTLIHHWFDLAVTSGTHKLYEVITKPYQSEVGKTLGGVILKFPTSSIEYKTTLLKNITSFIKTNTGTPTSTLATISTPTSSSSTAPHIITVSSDQTITSTSTLGEFTTTNSVKKNTPSKKITASSFLEPTKYFISNLTKEVTAKLAERKQVLDTELQQEKNHEPLTLLQKSAEQIENKTSFLKIPREKIPSLKQLQSWSLGLTILILKTWWIIIIVLVLIIWNIIKLFRYHQRKKYY